MPGEQSGLVITGVDEIRRSIADLQRRSYVNSVMRPGVTKGARIIRAKTKRNAPKKSGRLKRSFRSKARASKKGRPSVLGLVFSGGDPVTNFYAKPLELGGSHYNVRRTASGANRGRMPTPGLEYAQRAVRESESEVGALMVRETLAAIDKLVDRLAAKNKTPWREGSGR